ncbi:DUF4190 domain-containing protein [bacterium]|nr:DUF4190 domain-containing protein [bacterium]
MPAVICGHLAMKSFKNPQEPRGGKGMAIAGLICGYLGGVISLCMICFAAFFFNAKDGPFQKAREEAERNQQERIERFEENAD